MVWVENITQGNIISRNGELMGFQRHVVKQWLMGSNSWAVSMVNPRPHTSPLPPSRARSVPLTYPGSLTPTDRIAPAITNLEFLWKRQKFQLSLSG